MRLAVLTYQYDSNKPSGMPDAWPSQIKELTAEEPLPGEEWVEMTKEQLAEYKTTHQSNYDTYLANIAALESVRQRLLAAEEFGKSIIRDYALQNVLAGLTTEQVVEVMARTNKVYIALNTGSLYVALYEINLVTTDDVIVTPERVTEVRHKLQDYLGLERT